MWSFGFSQGLGQFRASGPARLVDLRRLGRRCDVVADSIALLCAEYGYAHAHRETAVLCVVAVRWPRAARERETERVFVDGCESGES